MKRSVIIQGSSRSHGDTSKIVNYIATNNNIDVVDLYTKNIGHYDYDYKNEGDDFIGLITHIVETYDTIIFATPVYWYSMSGILKVFFDRISDLIRIHKDTGRKLRGKNMAMISCSNHDDLKKGFSMPFVESANYLSMLYLGDIHTYIESDTINNEVKLRIDKFIKTISNAI
ncbi:flavodoxin family protein [Flavivirga spongiicola]|uniref:NAD(P)H-dependent oxidoreductase n=1 Tax=Flavivirga spongiicola TaxID=421621 RepID=A0ABU7XP81_9FLAO|nr:NAD(P)H-dependent oxidoreductase [Flavivirga sp. MEBiC05379]MDO5977573.1 NAD(P)H-dependent oxidoreductase [Flavivirga sp. MEBiC05379]